MRTAPYIIGRVLRGAGAVLLVSIVLLSTTPASAAPVPRGAVPPPVPSERTTPVMTPADAPPSVSSAAVTSSECALAHPSDLIPPRVTERNRNVECSQLALATERAAGYPGATTLATAPPGFGIYNMAVADDPADGYLLLLGATGGPGPENGTQTWTYFQGNWTEIFPTTFPESCIGSSLAYDPFDGYVVYLAGGNLLPSENCSSAGETWEFHAGLWSPLAPSTSPSPRQGAAFTNDSGDGYMLLFGGLSAGCNVTCNDTWAFLGGNWTHLPETVAPGNRSGAGMADDLSDGYVLLFGGSGSPAGCTRQEQDSPYCMLRDTWSFHLGAWTQLSPVGAVPPEPYDDGMIYDGAAHDVLYTVTDDNWSNEPEIWWTFHGGNWTNPQNNDLSSPGPAPPNRFGEGLAYDWTDGYSVLYGGTGIEFQPYNDTWEYSNSVWTNLSRGGGSSGSGPTYQVTFGESGLDSGTTWGLDLAGSSYTSFLSSIAFFLSNGSYGYSVDTVVGYSGSPSTGVVTVAGGPVLVNITYAAVVPPPEYNVTFREAGLPGGTAWVVTLGTSAVGSTSTTIVFLSSAGTYGYVVANVSGYTSQPPRGTLVVAASPVTAYVNFTPALTAALVEFVESGLPMGTSWSVTLGTAQSGSTQTSLSFVVALGTYGYTVSALGFAASPTSGILVVSGSTTVPVSFTSAASSTRTVDFVEVGLSYDTRWGVVFNGQSGSTTGGTLQFNVTPGGYNYFVLNSSGYLASPGSGSVDVSNQNVSLVIEFETLGPSTGPPPNYGPPITSLELPVGWILLSILGALAILAAMAVAIRARPPPPPPPPRPMVHLPPG